MAAAVFRGPFRALASPRLIGRVDPGLVVIGSGAGIALSGLVAAVWLEGLDRG
ncbi:MAG: hypothetical protein QOE98_642 [Gaiellaceae bacterium]|jgi:hypothetical protein|nr:hypothetical protein [Gaiellaceae bacterium]